MIDDRYFRPDAIDWDAQEQDIDLFDPFACAPRSFVECPAAAQSIDEMDDDPVCPVCGWSEDEALSLEEAQLNFRTFGMIDPLKYIESTEKE